MDFSPKKCLMSRSSHEAYRRETAVRRKAIPGPEELKGLALAFGTFVMLVVGLGFVARFAGVNWTGVAFACGFIAFWAAAGGVCGYVGGKARKLSDEDWRRALRAKDETINRLLERDDPEVDELIEDTREARARWRRPKD